MAEKEYIAKEFVIDAIEELKTKPMPKALLFNHLTKLIEIFPAEDFAPVKHGHWDVGYFHDRVCSNCLHPSNDLDDRPYHFCPHCGAKMDGGEGE